VRPRTPHWSEGAAHEVEALLARAQGRRQSRLLTPAQVRACLEAAAAAQAGFAWVHGGESGDPRGSSTVCLCVATPRGVVVGLSAARAQDVSPARAWKEITGWERYDEALNRAQALRFGERAGPDRLLLPWAEAPPVKGPEAFLAAIAAEPASDEPRLVYADWLSEHGDPRGEFISVQCALASLPADAAQAQALRGREEALLAEHSLAWLRGLPGGVVHRFERGFVSMLRVTSPDAVAELGPFIEREGVWRLVLACPVPSSLVVAPWLSRLRVLEVWGHAGLSPQLLEQLLSGRDLQGLEALLLRDQQPLGEAGIRTLAERGGAVFSSLRQLQLENARLSAAQLAVLAGKRWFMQLDSLSLSNNPDLGPAGLEVLASRLKQVKTLRLDSVRGGNEGARALAASAQLRQLVWLSLDRNRISAEGASALLQSGALPSLRRLSIEGNPIGRALRQRLDARFLT